MYAAGKFFYVGDIDKNLKDSSHQINSLELLDFDKSSLSNMRDSHRCSYILVGFQIDAFWSASDWLIFNEQRSDWLTVFSGQHLFKNPYMNIKLWLLDWITKLWSEKLRDFLLKKGPFFDILSFVFKRSMHLLRLLSCKVPLKQSWFMWLV